MRGKLKILISGLNFAPELTGTGKYTAEMAQWLAARGHQVRVVTAPPHYPDWKVWDGYSTTLYARETWNGVSVLRCPLWVPRRVSGLKRIIHLASFAVSNAFGMLRQAWWRPDVVWVVEPSLFTAPAALLAASLTGATSWLHIQDFEVDAAFEMGLLRGRRARWIATVVERMLMRSFDRVSSISGRMVALAARKGVSQQRLGLAPNWADIESVRPLDDASPYRSELGIAPGAVVALYSGNMGAKQGLELLAETARLLEAENDLAFVFCGQGAGRDDLVQRCASLSNVHFLPLQPKERLGELLGLADIHLLPQRADAADLVLPSKLTGMFASGRAAVVAADENTELGSVIRKSNAGLLVRPEDAVAMAEAVRALCKDPAERAAKGAAARIYAEKEFDSASLLARFEQELLELCNPSALRAEEHSLKS